MSDQPFAENTLRGNFSD